MENTSQQPRQATQLTANPGPVRHPCSSCMKPVTINHRAILCDNCGLWAHPIKCLLENIPKNTYVDMNNNKDRMLNFICSCVFFYVNEQLESHPLKHLSDSNYESLWRIRNADWTYFLNFSYLDRACKVFNDIVKTVAENMLHIYIYITHKINGKAEAWVTHDFLQTIKERDFLMTRANKSKSIINWDNFIKKRNQVTKLKNKLKQEYFNNLLSEDAKRPKQLWKA